MTRKHTPLWRTVALGSALLLASAVAAAQSILPAQDINLTPGANDLSMRLLRAVLGDWSGGTNNSVLGQAFTYFNSGVMVFASIIFMYISIMSVLRTAEDGELLGRGWSSIWIPMRVIGGLAVIFPTASGFSLVQIAVLWVAAQGIGFANLIFEKSAEGLVNGQGEIVAARLVDQAGAQNLMADILRAETCVADLNRIHGAGSFQRRRHQGYVNAFGGGGGGAYTWGNVNPSLPGYSIDHCGVIEIETTPFAAPSRDDSNIGRQDDLGGFSAAISTSISGFNAMWSGVKTAKAGVRNAQMEAIGEAAMILESKAKQLAKAGTQPDGTVSSTPAPTSAEILQAINEATRVYRSRIAAITQSSLANQNNVITASFLESSREAGWVGAGSWYYQMSRISTEINKVSAEAPNVIPGKHDPAVVVDPGIQGIGGTRHGIDASLDAMIAEAAAVSSRPIVPRLGQGGAGTTQSGLMGLLNDGSNAAFGSAAVWLGEAVAVDPNNPKNAVVQLKSVGDYLLGMAEAGFAVSKVAGKFAGSNPIAKLTTKFGKPKISEPIGMLIFVATTSILTFAMILAFWIPIVPFIIWIGSVLGWLISVLEMVIAAPLWAAAHLHPEGEGMAGKWGYNGYMIIAEIFARPVLMIFGLIGAMIVVDPFLRFASSLFFNTMDTVNADSISGIVTMIVFMLMYVTFCISLMNRIFSLITIIPKSVLRYIGASQLGMHDQGQQAADEMKSGTSRGLSQSQAVISNTHRALDAAAERRARLEKAEARPNPGGTTHATDDRVDA